MPGRWYSVIVRLSKRRFVQKSCKAAVTKSIIPRCRSCTQGRRLNYFTMLVRAAALSLPKITTHKEIGHVVGRYHAKSIALRPRACRHTSLVATERPRTDHSVQRTRIVASISTTLVGD